MATEISRYQSGSLRKLMDKHLNLKTRIAKINEKAEGVIEGLVRTVEIQGAAFVFGAVQGAWFDPKGAGDKPGAHFFGIPVEAFFGIGLHMMALVGVGGKYSDHLRNFADGALAAYVANIGRGWGFKFAKERKERAGTSGTSLRDEIASLLDA